MNVPEVTFKSRIGDNQSLGGGCSIGGEWKDINTNDLFKNKKVVLFAVPGAFTPGCSINHLPSYLENAKAIYSKGVDTIACLSVNDIFVMSAWAKDKMTGDSILMLADGNCDLTNELGLTMDGSGFGLGNRCKRFAMIVDDGIVQSIDIEEPGAMDVSSGESQLAKI